MGTRNRVGIGLSYRPASAEIFKQSMGARNQVGIVLSYRPARLHSLESISGLLQSLKIRPRLLYIGWRNRFCGIDSWHPWKFKIWALDRLRCRTFSLRCLFLLIYERGGRVNAGLDLKEKVLLPSHLVPVYPRTTPLPPPPHSCGH